MVLRTPDGTAYVSDGPADGPALIFIHGLGLTRRTFDTHLPAYRDRYRVITYDLFGHGESAAPPDVPSLTLFSEQVSRLLDYLRIDRAALIGFSLGGMINRRFALDFRDRVSALVILNTTYELA